MALFPANMSSGGTWTDIKKSGVTGTFKYRKIENDLYALHINTNNLTIGSYNIIGTLPSGCYSTAEDMWFSGVTGAATFCVVRIYHSTASGHNAGDVAIYIASGSNQACSTDIVYAL